MLRYALGLILVMSVPQVTVGRDTVHELVADVESLQLEYSKTTPGNSVSYWQVPFNGDEVRSLGAILEKATRYEPTPQERIRDESMSDEPTETLVFIRSYSGELRTRRQTFHIRVGQQKWADQPVLFVLRDREAPAEERVYRLQGDDANAFLNHLEGALEAKAQSMKPDRVVHPSNEPSVESEAR